MSYYPLYFAVIARNIEEHCGSGSILPLEESHITPELTPSLGTTVLRNQYRWGALTMISLRRRHGTRLQCFKGYEICLFFLVMTVPLKLAWFISLLSREGHLSHNPNLINSTCNASPHCPESEVTSTKAVAPNKFSPKKKKRNRWPGTKGKQQNYPRHLCNRSFFSQHKKSQLVWDTALFHAGSARNKKCISSWRLPLTTTVIQETGHQRIKQHSSEMLASLVSRKPVPQNEWEVGTLQQLE